MTKEIRECGTRLSSPRYPLLNRINAVGQKVSKINIFFKRFRSAVLFATFIAYRKFDTKMNVGTANNSI
jgi:hypothetical protein